MATWAAINQPQPHVEALAAKPRLPTPPQQHDQSPPPPRLPIPSASRSGATAGESSVSSNDPVANAEPSWHPSNWTLHEILNEREGEEETEFLTAWASSIVPKKHLHRLSASCAYVMVGHLRCPVRFTLDEVGENVEVEWEPTWNGESDFDQTGEDAIAEFRAKRSGLAPEHIRTTSHVELSIEDPDDDEDIVAIRALPEATLPAADVDADTSAPKAGVCYTRLVLMYCKQKHPTESVAYASRACRRRLKRRIQFQPKWVRRGGALRLSCHSIRNAALGFAVGKERRPCAYCENGNGPYPKCVTDRYIGNGACMNCMHTGGKACATCDHRKSKTNKARQRQSQLTREAEVPGVKLNGDICPRGENLSVLPSSPPARYRPDEAVDLPTSSSAGASVSANVADSSSGPSSSSQLLVNAGSSSSSFDFDIDLYGLTESENESEDVKPGAAGTAPLPPRNDLRPSRPRRYRRPVNLADHWTCTPLRPCVGRYCSYSTPQDVIVYSDQTFAESEASFEEVCYIISRCYCDRAEDFELIWKDFEQSRKNRRLRGEILDDDHLRVDKEGFLSTHHFDLLNETIAAVCPSRFPYSGEVIELLSDDDCEVVPHARRRTSKL